MRLRYLSLPLTTAHHLRPGILLLCESYSCVWRTGMLMVFWKVGTDSMEESTLFLCTFAECLHFSGRGEEVFACAKRVHGGKTTTFCVARPITFFIITYLTSQKILILSETWRNDCRKSTMKLFLGCTCDPCLSWC